MKVTVLGSGTSSGVPVIGCGCGVCRSDDPRNRRSRASLTVQANGATLLVDTATDLRTQALTHGLTRVDAVLYTHAHADHVHGIDELRVFNYLMQCTIPCYGPSETLDRLQRIFPYAFDGQPSPTWTPKLVAHPVAGLFEVHGISVLPVEILHGAMRVYGYRFGNMAYLTDCSAIPDASLEHLRDLEVLILGVIRHEPHSTHFHLEAGLRAIEAIRPQRTFLTHLSHAFDFETTSRELPPSVSLAYDGLTLEL